MDNANGNNLYDTLVFLTKVNTLNHRFRRAPEQPLEIIGFALVLYFNNEMPTCRILEPEAFFGCVPSTGTPFPQYHLAPFIQARPVPVNLNDFFKNPISDELAKIHRRRCPCIN